VTLYRGNGMFVSANTVRVGDETINAKHILIAVGGRPTVPTDVEGLFYFFVKLIEHVYIFVVIVGAKYGITSDGFFDLNNLPK
jgi:glutathione reductase (NADPH)